MFYVNIQNYKSQNFCLYRNVFNRNLIPYLSTHLCSLILTLQPLYFLLYKYFSSVLSGMNGTHSPLGLNGRTPSPPSALPNSASNQQLPPACGARQLSKLKRFLTTLQQFGSDISPDIGERVRTLVLGLVVSNFYFFSCRTNQNLL